MAKRVSSKSKSRTRSGYDNRKHGKADGVVDRRSSTRHAGHAKKQIQEPHSRVPNVDAAKATSELQSDARKKRKGTFVPHWAKAITPDFAERLALGEIDYWLGSDQNGEVRTRGRRRYVDDNGTPWWILTSREFAKRIGAMNKIQAWRILGRLARKGIVFKERVSRNGYSALRIRLDWDRIQEAFIATGDLDTM